MNILTFDLDDQRYAFPANQVVQVVQMVTISPLPGAPEVVEGVVNVRGTVIPVFDLRARFGLPARPVDPAQHLVILGADGGPAAVRVDSAEDFLSVADADITGATTLAGPGIDAEVTRHVAGIAATPDGTTIIYDLSAFLSQHEATTLEHALAPTGG